MSEFLRAVLKEYSCRKGKLPKKDPNYDVLRMHRNRLGIEIRTYAASLIPALEELGPHPKTCDSDDHRRQMWRAVIPLQNNVRALAKLTAILAKVTQLATGRRSVGVFSNVMYPEGKASKAYRVYRDLRNFADWLARQTKAGKKAHKERQDAWRKRRDTVLPPELKAQETEKDRHRKHLARWRANVGPDFVGPPPPSREYRRKTANEDVNQTSDCAAE